MAKYVYVDNSNVWIEGRKVAAVADDFAYDVFDEAGRIGFRWSYDFGKLLEHVGGKRNGLKTAVLFGSRPPENDTLWNAARQSGFEVVVEDRNAQNREKKIDTGIAVRMMEDSFEVINPKEDEMILVAGDADYVPVLLSLGRRGISVVVYFWKHAAASELKNAAARFEALDPHLASFRR